MVARLPATHQRFLPLRSLPNRRLTPSCSVQSHPYCPCRHPRGAGHRCAAFGVAVQQAHSWAGFLGAFIFERLRFWCQPAGARAHALGALCGGGPGRHCSGGVLLLSGRPRLPGAAAATPWICNGSDCCGGGVGGLFHRGASPSGSALCAFGLGRWGVFPAQR